MGQQSEAAELVGLLCRLRGAKSNIADTAKLRIAQSTAIVKMLTALARHFPPSSKVGIGAGRITGRMAVLH